MSTLSELQAEIATLREQLETEHRNVDRLFESEQQLKRELEACHQECARLREAKRE